MKIKWLCDCGFTGECELGYWMRCDNPICNRKNSFRVLSIEGIGDIPNIDDRLRVIETRILKLEENQK